VSLPHDGPLAFHAECLRIICVARRRSIDKAPLELFFEWSHLEFRRPGAAILMG
jgi:hypothetical protein